MNSFWPRQQFSSDLDMAAPRALDHDAYIKMRDKIRTADESKRFSARNLLTPDEEKVAKKLDALRASYIQNFMREAPDPKIPFLNPSHLFWEQKADIEKTGLFHILQGMPKGGNLHLHTSSSCTAEWIFDTLIASNQKPDKDRQLPVAYIYLGEAPVIGKTKVVKGELAFFLKDPPAGFERLELKHRPHLNLLKFAGRTSVSQVPYIWDEFNCIFARVSNLFLNKEFYRMYYEQSFNLLVDDNVSYLELRTGMTTFKGASDFMFAETAPAGLDSATLEGYLARESVENQDDTFVHVLRDAAAAADKYANGKGRRFRLKLILSSTRRSFIKEEGKEKEIEQAVIDKIRTAAKLHEAYQHFIVGFDFVSEEDRGGRTLDCAKIILENKLYDGIDFYFHDGESNWADDDNVLDAYLLASRRVGHGFNLFRFPALLEAYCGNADKKEAPTVLEICPISNQMLRYTNDLRNHPAYELMKRGVQCVIASDDPQIFENHGLTHDFFAAYFWMQLSFQDIKALVFNSVDYSAADEVGKKEMRGELEAQWNDFIVKTSAS